METRVLEHWTGVTTRVAMLELASSMRLACIDLRLVLRLAYKDLTLDMNAWIRVAGSC